MNKTLSMKAPVIFVHPKSAPTIRARGIVNYQCCSIWVFDRHSKSTSSSWPPFFNQPNMITKPPLLASNGKQPIQSRLLPVDKASMLDPTKKRGQVRFHLSDPFQIFFALGPSPSGPFLFHACLWCHTGLFQNSPDSWCAPFQPQPQPIHSTRGRAQGTWLQQKPDAYSDWWTVARGFCWNSLDFRANHCSELCTTLLHQCKQHRGFCPLTNHTHITKSSLPKPTSAMW